MAPSEAQDPMAAPTPRPRGRRPPGRTTARGARVWRALSPATGWPVRAGRPGPARARGDPDRLAARALPHRDRRHPQPPAAARARPTGSAPTSSAATSFSRVIAGARVSLQVGFIAVGISLVGRGAARARGRLLRRRIDDVLMRLMDVLFAFPPILLAIAILAILGPGMANAMIAIGIVFTPIFARSPGAASCRPRGGLRARGPVARRQRPAPAAPARPAERAGPDHRADLDQPRVRDPAEAALSFLGLGVQPPTRRGADAVPRAGVHPARLVDGGLPRPGDLRHRARVQRSSATRCATRSTRGRSRPSRRGGRTGLCLGSAEPPAGGRCSTRCAARPAGCASARSAAWPRWSTGSATTCTPARRSRSSASPGSGKSVACSPCWGWCRSRRRVTGEVRFDGRDLLDSGRGAAAVRGNDIAMIFQDPMTSLNPVLTIGRQLTEGMELHLG
jgi:hypothetical protein